MKSPQKELVADGNRRKPPRSLHSTSSNVSDKDIDHSDLARPLSIASSDAMTLMDDIDNDGTSTASESYAHDESSSNEGNRVTNKEQTF